MRRIASAEGSALDALPLYLPRLYYSFLGMVERRLEACGLARHLQPGMGHLLLALYEADDCIIKDLGQRVQIANGTLTGILRRMEQAGLIETRKCQEDGRAVRVRLSPLGRRLRPDVDAFHEEITRVLQAGMGEEEIANAHRLFGGLLATMRADDPRAKAGIGKAVKTQGKGKRK